MTCSDGRDADIRFVDRREFDDLTAMLCESCRVIEAGGLSVSRKIEMWYKAHKDADDKRRGMFKV